MNKLIKRFFFFLFFLGFTVGVTALPYQYIMFDMEAPNWTWFFKAPFLGFCFGVISSGSVFILLVLLCGIIELFDKNTYWPHV